MIQLKIQFEEEKLLRSSLQSSNAELEKKNSSIGLRERKTKRYFRSPNPSIDGPECSTRERYSSVEEKIR